MEDVCVRVRVPEGGGGRKDTKGAPMRQRGESEVARDHGEDEAKPVVKGNEATEIDRK